MASDKLTVAIGIPTYQRGTYLVETVQQVLAQVIIADEILVVDQTPEHPPEVASTLHDLHAEGKIRWFRQQIPNAQIARNRCLLESKCDVVIFIDDDVVLPQDFIATHMKNYDDPKVTGVAGRVISRLTPRHADTFTIRQPRKPEFDFKFFRLDGAHRIEGVANLIGANHSVRRQRLLGIGGCDENYMSPVLDDVDTAIRLWKSNNIIVYDPEAWLEHLMAPAGGHGVRPNKMPLWKRYFATHYFYQRHVFPHWYFWFDILFSNFRRSVINRQIVSRPWIMPWAALSYWLAFARAALTAPRLLSGCRSTETP